MPDRESDDLFAKCNIPTPFRIHKHAREYAKCIVTLVWCTALYLSSSIETQSLLKFLSISSLFFNPQNETPPQHQQQQQQQQQPPSTWQVSPATQNQSPRRYPQISSSPILFRSNLPGGKHLGSQVVLPDLGGMTSGIGTGGGGAGGGDSDNNNDLPMTFHAPELPAETILDKQHNETLAKLNFVLALTDCILEVADARCAPLSALMAPDAPPIAAHAPEHCKRAERLVLLVRSLHLLRSGLLLAQEQIQLKNLKPSSTVKTGECVWVKKVPLQ